jgi:hypothetical protein
MGNKRTRESMKNLVGRKKRLKEEQEDRREQVESVKEAREI